jgi:hypothetical protein
MRWIAVSLTVILCLKFLVAILANPGVDTLYFIPAGWCPFPLKPIGKGTGCNSAASLCSSVYKASKFAGVIRGGKSP